jgi:hypothetical protein
MMRKVILLLAAAMAALVSKIRDVDRAGATDILVGTTCPIPFSVRRRSTLQSHPVFFHVSGVLGAVLAACTVAWLVTAESPVSATVLPPGFEDKVVASVGNPTALASTPDGRVLIASKVGRLRVYKNGALLSTPAVDLSAKMCGDSERGC